MRSRAASASADPHLSILEIGAELSANPDNRVRLSRDVDALGMRRLSLHCDLSAFDKESMQRAVEVFALRMGRSLDARVRVEMAPNFRWRSVYVGNHHMGTTRMHANPRQGVVDADCRVHGVPNLWIAGSSVFPTAGPEGSTTITLLALALRLSDQLAKELDA